MKKKNAVVLRGTRRATPGSVAGWLHARARAWLVVAAASSVVVRPAALVVEKYCI